MLRVYIAGAYSSNPEANTQLAMDAGDIVQDHGMSPYIPHLTHFRHLRKPRQYEHWLKHDAAWLPLCHVVFRLSGESTGADFEVAWAGRFGIPVVYNIQDLLALQTYMQEKLPCQVIEKQLNSELKSLKISTTL